MNAVIGTISIVVGSIVILIGIPFWTEGMVLAGFGLAAFGSLFIAAGVGVFNHGREISRKLAQSYAWYQTTYPNLVKNGKVICHSCGGSHISMRNLMNRTFLRAHVCSRCGEELYYSPEK